MPKNKRAKNPTIKDLLLLHDKIIRNQFSQVEVFQTELALINEELKTNRFLQQQMRSPQMRNQLANRQKQLIEMATKLNESTTILYMAALNPLFQIAKIIETESKPSESEAPTTSMGENKLSVEDLKALYTKYEE